MASLQERNSTFRVIFRYHGKQYFVTLGKVSADEAAAKAAQVDYLLMRLKQGLIEIPAGSDIVEFIERDGKPPKSGIAAGEDVANSVAKTATIGMLRDRYLAGHGSAHEKSTQKTARTHFKHLVTTLGEKCPLPGLSTADLQRHIDRRAGEGVSAVTIKKELESARAAWNWGRPAGLVLADWPGKGLVYPKIDEPPPFQTLDEIRRQITKGRIPKAEQPTLWEALYLRVPEVADLLTCVKENAAHPWIYPLVCTAAHTGMRRSELVRARLTDVDFEGDSIIIHERKRVKGKRSTRRAPLTPLLRAALHDWVAIHPGGNALFCHVAEVARSSKRSRTTGHQNGEGRPKTTHGRLATVTLRDDRLGIGPLTVNECHDHVKRTLAETRWNVVRGLHVLRHSFISGLAAAGVDQRLIDDIVGHTSEEVRRRYRHLTPASKTQAVALVFA